MSEESDSWEKDVVAWLGQACDPLQRASAADIATWLVDDLLVKADRMTMAHSLEGRAPFLFPGLVDLALNLPQSQRMTDTTSKVALRRVARNYLPEDIVTRRKQGFVLPMRRWLGEWFEAHGTPKAYFSTRPFPHLDTARLTDLVAADVLQGVQRERFLFAIIMLVEWWQAFQPKRARLLALRESLRRSRG